MSTNTGISLKYAEKVIKPLRDAGLVKSLRGPAGGYSLARPASKITLGDIVTAIEGGVHLTCCCEDPERCARFVDCRNRQIWRNVSQTLTSELDKISLEDLMYDPGPGFKDECLGSGDDEAEAAGDVSVTACS